MSKGKELARTVSSWPVADRYLNDAKPSELEFSHHLHTNNAAVGFERQVFENLSPEKPKIAIDILYGKVKDQPHRTPVCFSNPNAVPRIGAGDFVAIYDINIWAQRH
jgi:hypothetical protein